MTLVVIVHRGGGRMRGYAEAFETNAVDVVFSPSSGGDMRMARTRFSLAHGWGEKKASDWRLENLDELREVARALGLKVTPVPRSTGRPRAARKPKPEHPRQLSLFEAGGGRAARG